MFDTFKKTVLRPLRIHLLSLKFARTLSLVQDNLAHLKRSKYVSISTLRNEAFRIAAFIDHHERLGVDHFVFIDNESTDNLYEVLRGRTNVTIFHSQASYKDTRFGICWSNYILSRYCAGKWILSLDPDEYLVYPGCDAIRLPQLTAAMTDKDCRSLCVTMVDMYSERGVAENVVADGQNALDICPYFDAEGYEETRSDEYDAVIVRGGPRARVFFDRKVAASPTLNKVPLILWRRHYAYLHSAHFAWPYGLNTESLRRMDGLRGALLHFKFVASFATKVAEETVRQQHAVDYANYVRPDIQDLRFYSDVSRRYDGWRSLAACNIVRPGALTISEPKA